MNKTQKFRVIFDAPIGITMVTEAHGFATATSWAANMRHSIRAVRCEVVADGRRFAGLQPSSVMKFRTPCHCGCRGHAIVVGWPFPVEPSTAFGAAPPKQADLLELAKVMGAGQVKPAPPKPGAKVSFGGEFLGFVSSPVERDGETFTIRLSAATPTRPHWRRLVAVAAWMLAAAWVVTMFALVFVASHRP